MCRSSFTCFFGTADIFTGRSLVNLVGRNLPRPHGASILAHFARSRIDLAGDLRKGWNRSDYIFCSKQKGNPQKQVFFWLDIYLLNTNIHIIWIYIYIYHINIIIRLTGLWCIYLSRRTRIFFCRGMSPHKMSHKKQAFNSWWTCPFLSTFFFITQLFFSTTVKVFFLELLQWKFEVIRGRISHRSSPFAMVRVISQFVSYALVM